MTATLFLGGGLLLIGMVVEFFGMPVVANTIYSLGALVFAGGLVWFLLANVNVRQDIARVGGAAHE